MGKSTFAAQLIIYLIAELVLWGLRRPQAQKPADRIPYRSMLSNISTFRTLQESELEGERSRDSLYMMALAVCFEPRMLNTAEAKVLSVA